MDPEDYSELIADLAPDLRPETTPVRNAAGRTTASVVTAPRAVPDFAASAMDGFALDEAALASARNGETIRVVGDTPAGHGVNVLQPGCAVRVMTGAPVPTDSEAVVPVELTDARQTGPAPYAIKIDSLPSPVPPGWNIRPIGEDMNRGDIVLPAGERITAAGVGALAMLGIGEVETLRTPRIGLIVTGDEIHGANQTGETGTEATTASIFNSNLPMLAAAARGLGAEPIEATSSDDADELLSVLTRMQAEADLVVTTGGISAGAFEVVRQALEPDHSTFRRLEMRPGSPQGYGRFGALPMIHLPGTPQGAFVAFHLFVGSLMTGQNLRQRWRKGILTGSGLRRHGNAVTFRPGTFTESGEILAADRARLPDFATADVIIRIPRATDSPQGDESLNAGTVIDYLEC
ncbi:molybdopterin molybdochelatase [Brevibacterium siliguriense]|uniref:Molybdopterin molybdenumtransferase n=1 Tax=Brevibacterium siliguriense TaxID=1136497 RepID=A0A1H1UPA6_9MICO|nr:molybdopterin molybdotransferase MoeA [Brevibacterium siliguriense]SDS74110.1 molybdopterin molybdochelatase [Brevibacterium siliguriense]